MTAFVVVHALLWLAVAIQSFARVLGGDRNAEWALAVASVLFAWALGLLLFGRELAR